MDDKPTRLVMKDVNNKLQCFGFIQINFAPAAGSVREEDFGKQYLVNREGEDIIVKLVDFTRIPFGKIGSIITVPATGFTSNVWKDQWLYKHPETKDETEMAVYCYLRQR